MAATAAAHTRPNPRPPATAFIATPSVGLPLVSLRPATSTTPLRARDPSHQRSPPPTPAPVPVGLFCYARNGRQPSRRHPLRATMSPTPGVSGAGAVSVDAAPAGIPAALGGVAAVGATSAAVVGNGAKAAAAAAPAAAAAVATAPAGLTGAALLRHGGYSAGLRYTTEQRAALGLTGLLPPAVESLQTQVARVVRRMGDLRRGLDQYEYLASVDAADERLFYATVLTHLTEIMPLIYTPVVGAACQNYGRLYVRPRGLFLSIASPLSAITEALSNWPEKDVRVIVMTDGERILGLGDLGAHGHGIPVGKLSLYTACGGIHPRHTLPITLDTGTDNAELRADPAYLGNRFPRVRGVAYDTFVSAVLAEIVATFGRHVLCQFEDFAQANAARLLVKHRESYTTFNDDIQGTAAVATAGVLAALRLNGVRPQVREHTFLFLGAGSAGIGIADLLCSQMLAEDAAAAAAAGTAPMLTPAAARGRCFFLDSKGIVARGRAAPISAEKAPYAATLDAAAAAVLGADPKSLLTAVQTLRPTALIGVSTVHGAFTPAVLGAMAAANERPLVFALSNPTSQSECTAAEAVAATDGRVVFASGSPFPPVPRPDGSTMVPGQGNNAYVFPGLGAGVVLAGASTVPDALFLTAARALAAAVTPDRLAVGAVYPPIEEVRHVSAVIALAVAHGAAEMGIATRDVGGLTLEGVLDSMYDPLR